MIDPCETLHSIDFNNEEDLQKILLRDKHTRIEGLFTEVFFHEEILKDSFDTITTGWWFSLKRNEYFISKFVYSIDNLSLFDFELLEYFSGSNRHVFVVAFSEASKKFYYARYESGTGKDIIDRWHLISREYPRNPHSTGVPSEKERNIDRLSQAISYLQQRGTLKKYAIERMFANCWLGSGAIWDVDFFVKYKGALIAFEVKQKFTTANKTWGLNVGLANLFAYLDSIKITVVHVILEKPVNDASIPAIDLYTKPEYKKKAHWIAIKFYKDILKMKKGIAPKKTSIDGLSDLTYFHLPPGHFTLIKELNSPENNILCFLDTMK